MWPFQSSVDTFINLPKPYLYPTSTIEVARKRFHCMWSVTRVWPKVFLYGLRSSSPDTSWLFTAKDLKSWSEERQLRPFDPLCPSVPVRCLLRHRPLPTLAGRSFLASDVLLTHSTETSCIHWRRVTCTCSKCVKMTDLWKMKIIQPLDSWTHQQ